MTLLLLLMHTRPRTRRASRPGPALLLAALALLASCGKDRAPMQPSTGVYDFALVDVNPTSPTVGDTVGTSAFLGKPVVLFIGAAT